MKISRKIRNLPIKIMERRLKTRVKILMILHLVLSDYFNSFYLFKNILSFINLAIKFYYLLIFAFLS
jgi:hypothetical protein